MTLKEYIQRINNNTEKIRIAIKELEEDMRVITELEKEA